MRLLEFVFRNFEPNRFFVNVYSFAFFLAVATAGMLHGCTTIQCGSGKAQFLDNYNRFMEEALEKDFSVADKRWHAYDERLETYILDCYPSFSEDLTFADRQSVLSQAVSYYYIRYGSHMIKELQNEDNEVSVALMAELEEVWSDPKALFREVVGEDWDEMVNEFLEDLDEWKTRFRDLLEEQ